MITRTNSFLLFWEGEETLGSITFLKFNSHYQYKLVTVKLKLDTYRMHLSSNTSQICSNNSDSMRLDPRTVEQSVPDLVTLPLPCL